MDILTLIPVLLGHHDSPKLKTRDPTFSGTITTKSLTVQSCFSRQCQVHNMTDMATLNSLGILETSIYPYYNHLVIGWLIQVAIDCNFTCPVGEIRNFPSSAFGARDC